MMKIESKVGILFICAAILFLSFVGTASAKTLYVPDDYSAIQAAVDAANADDTIIVRDGIYTENVDVNKRLTLRSENGADSTIVQAAKSDDHVFSVTVDHVSISGFTVKGANGPYCPAGIHLYYAENCNISNNYASNNGEGIRLLDSPNCIIIGNNVNSNNEFGINLYISSPNCIIAGNNVNSNNECGIGVGHSLNCTITGNNVNSNYACGIQLYDSSNSIIIGNNANSNNGCGIHLSDSSNNTITGNNASNNGNGIHLRDSSNNNTITGNNASNNSNGISLDFSSSNMIANNNANSNSYSGILLRRSSNNKIYLNNFIDNIHNVYSLESTNIWNSTSMITYIYNEVTYENYRGNYWSDYNGTDTNNDGIGDASYSIDSDKDNYPLMEYWKSYATEITPTTPIPSPVTPTVTSIATPSPSPTPRTTPTTSGFGVFFAIAGLLVVAHLLRMRK